MKSRLQLGTLLRGAVACSALSVGAVVHNTAGYESTRQLSKNLPKLDNIILGEVLSGTCLYPKTSSLLPETHVHMRRNWDGSQQGFKNIVDSLQGDLDLRAVGELSTAMDVLQAMQNHYVELGLERIDGG